MHVAILPELVKRTKSHTHATDLFYVIQIFENPRNESPCPKLRKGVKSNPIYLGRYPPSHLQDSSKIKSGFICASHISIKSSTRKTNKKKAKNLKKYRKSPTVRIAQEVNIVFIRQSVCYSYILFTISFKIFYKGTELT